MIAPACTAGAGEDAALSASTRLSSSVSAFLQRFDEYDKVRAVLVYRHGTHLFELWRGERAHDDVNVRSITASVISMLIGVAIDDGRIAGVNETLGDLLPRYRDVMSAEVAAIPLRAILSHTAGFAPSGFVPGDRDEPFSSSPDWVRAIIADRVARGPGDGSFAYSSAGAHLLAAILDEATPGSVLDYARSHLLDAIGIDSRAAWVDSEGAGEAAGAGRGYFVGRFAWPTDPKGIARGDGPLQLSPEDLLRLGQLYLDRGEWHGPPLISPQWVSASTESHTSTGGRPSGYGYGWWVDDLHGESMFLALGYAGTVVAVIPDKDLAVVVVSEDPGHGLAQLIQQFHTDEAINLIDYAILPQLP